MLPLLPYQQTILEDIKKRKRALLWLDVGTGKTAIALRFAEEMMSRTLYICPSILKNQVKTEVERFTQLDAVACSGNHAERTALLKEKHDLYIINFEMLLTHFKEIWTLNCPTIIIDECQKIASPTNKTTKALKKLSPINKLAMSGTPCPNALHELWSVADWLFPKAFCENFYQWRLYNCKMNPYFPSIIGYFNEEKIRVKFNAFTIRLRREEVLDLPPLTEKRFEINLSPKHMTAYNYLKENLFLEINKATQLLVPNLLVLLTRLRQIVDCPRIVGLDYISDKEKALDEVLELINEPVIVFFEHTQVLNKINEKHNALVISGEVPQNKRDSVIQEFKDKKNKLLFCTSAGAEGLNLQFARHVVHYQLPYTDARVEQREGRIYRHGQNQECFTYRIIAKNTVDHKLEQIIAKKRKLNREDLIQLIK